MPGRCQAVEQLFFEDFESFNLQQLPAGWTIPDSPGDFSIVDEPGHGKVLKISHKGVGHAKLTVTLDAAKVNGHDIRLSALAKFPGAYTPIPEKPWARPKILLTFKDKDGKEQNEGRDLEPSKPEWLTVSARSLIPKDAQSATASLSISLVAAEVYFDNFCVEVDPDLNSLPPTAKAAAGAAGAAAAASGNPAERAPRKTLDSGGVLFGPEIAAAMQKAVKPRGSYTFAVVGPGLAPKEFEAAPPEKWTRLPGGKDLNDPAASPRNLLGLLPLTLAAQKPEQRPEVVFVIGETTTKRKTGALESLDWEDLARVCLRMGAVPVLAVPPSPPAKEGPVTMPDDQRTVMLRAAGEVNCPVVDLGVRDPKDPARLARLFRQMFTSLDKYVFCRIPLDQVGVGRTPGKKVEDE